MLCLTGASCQSPPPAPAETVLPVHLAPGIAFLRDGPAPRLELEARICLDAGWLEQLACSPGTREHEALVAVPARPSAIHAGLLMLGLECGSPGRWIWEGQKAVFIGPTGDRVNITVRVGSEPEVPLTSWVRSGIGGATMPETSFVFGGSRFVEHPELGEVYAADHAGSIIGLATFGDEVLGLPKGVSPEDSVAPAEWEVDADRIPAWGTDVVIVLRPAGL